MGLWCYGRYGKGYRSCQVEKMDSKEISNRINISKNTFSRIGINLQKNQIKSDEIGDRHPTGYRKYRTGRTENQLIGRLLLVNKLIFYFSTFFNPVWINRLAFPTEQYPTAISLLPR